MTEASYGSTKGGTPITEEMIQGFADEAERGYSSELLVTKRRGPGRPPLGNTAKKVGSIRLDPALREEAARRAKDDGCQCRRLFDAHSESTCLAPDPKSSTGRNALKQRCC